VGESAVALEFNGIAYAVMMASPTDLADFATGFALTEGLAANAAAVGAIAIAQVPLGWVIRATIPGLGADRLAERVRTRVAESSCGLCGIESLEALARPLPPAAAHTAIPPAAIFAALAQLPPRQTLGQATGAAHAAAWADATGAIGLVREDVGRHTALDKLVGAMARAGRPLSPGFILSTARCSFEIVEKAVRAGATTLVTISLPTTLAVERAQAAGLSLWALARPDSVLCVHNAATA
jgi:FdhD protein